MSVSESARAAPGQWRVLFKHDRESLTQWDLRCAWAGEDTCQHTHTDTHTCIHACEHVCVFVCTFTCDYRHIHK